jgi:hypothetical protein
MINCLGDSSHFYDACGGGGGDDNDYWYCNHSQ